MSTLKNLKKIYLDRLDKMDHDKWENHSQERHIRHMRKRYHQEFDKVWVKYNNKQATFQEWQKALDLWLNSELI